MAGNISAGLVQQRSMDERQWLSGWVFQKRPQRAKADDWVGD